MKEISECNSSINDNGHLHLTESITWYEYWVCKSTDDMKQLWEGCVWKWI